MREEANTDLTRLFDQSARGDSAAINAAFPIVYDQLHALAIAFMKGRKAGHTLQPTALVHEAYVKLLGADCLRVNDRAHFLSLAARAMRQILVNHARDRSRQKRGGGWNRITLEQVVAPAGVDQLDVLVLDDALRELGALSERKAQLVELRFFGGLSIEEAADVLGAARSTLADDWAFSRAWLSNRLAGATRS
jgi:RNA polymerase sigma factor (TIGR02999 family)